MTEFIHVRARDTGAKGSIPAKRFDPQIYVRTGESPFDRHGMPKSWKPKTTYEKARKRTRSKNSAPKTQEPAPLDPLSDDGAELDETGPQADTPKEND